MKKFALFALVATLATTLVHLIMTWCLGVEDPGTVSLLIPIGFVFVLFYARSPGATPN
jgi:hypothetical protein